MHYASISQAQKQILFIWDKTCQRRKLIAESLGVGNSNLESLFMIYSK